MLDILGIDSTGVDDVVVDSKNFVLIRPFEITSWFLFYFDLEDGKMKWFLLKFKIMGFRSRLLNLFFEIS